MDEVIARLKRLDARASSGPWFVRELNDEVMMSSVAVSTRPPHEESDLGAKAWPAGEVVAACLIQGPQYVLPGDGRHDENAELIAAVRNALPALLRLAEVGLQAERSQQDR